MGNESALIVLDSGKFPVLRELWGSQKAELFLDCQVVSYPLDGKVCLTVRKISVHSKTQSGKFDQLLNIARNVLRNLEEMPKTKPLGQ